MTELYSINRSRLQNSNNSFKLPLRYERVDCKEHGHLHQMYRGVRIQLRGNPEAVLPGFLSSPAESQALLFENNAESWHIEEFISR